MDPCHFRSFHRDIRYRHDRVMDTPSCADSDMRVSEALRGRVNLVPTSSSMIELGST